MKDELQKIKEQKNILLVMLLVVLPFATSILLEIDFFKQPVRYALVVFIIVLEIVVISLMIKENNNAK